MIDYSLSSSEQYFSYLVAVNKLNKIFKKKLYTNEGGMCELGKQLLTAIGKVRRNWVGTNNLVFVAATICLLVFKIYKTGL